MSEEQIIRAGGGSILVTGDWEVTEERIAILEGPVQALINRAEEDPNIIGFAFTGDMFRRFTPTTVLWVRERISAIKAALWGRLGLGEDPIMIFVAGNHDRVVGVDRLSAIFEGEFHISTEPEVLRFDTYRGGREFAVLPAPDRATFGTFRDAEGPRSRDAAISEALEAAIVYLKQNSAPDTPLLFHGSIAEDEFGPGVIAGGLTWAIPAVRVFQFAAAIGGHIHNPKTFSCHEERFVGYTGTPAPDTHGIGPVDFRYLALSGTKVESFSFPAAVQMIEVDIVPEGVAAPLTNRNKALEYGACLPGVSLANLGAVELARGLASYLETINLVDRLRAAPAVDLKLVLRLPKSSLSIFPSTENLREELEKAGIRVYKLSVRREPENETKGETTESIGGKLSPRVLFEEFLRTSGLDLHPAAPRAREFLCSDAFIEWTRTERRSFVPLYTTVHNYRQFEDATIDWTKFRGKVSITGDNTAGKSNLAKATIFATHKKLPGGSVRLEEILRFGTDSGSVEAGFIADGVEFVVRRGLERNKKGAVACKTEFFRVDASGERFGLNAEEETAGDIDRKIIDIVGPLSNVVSTFYGMGSDVTRIVRATPAEFRAIVADAFALSLLEDFRVYCAAEGKTIGGKIAPIDTALNVHAGNVATISAALGDMRTEKDIAGALEYENSGISLGREELEVVRRDMIELSKKSGALTARLEERENLEGKVENLKRQIRGAEAGIDRIDAAIRANSDNSETSPPAGDPNDLEKKLDDARNLFINQRAKRDDLSRTVSTLEGRLAGAIRTHKAAIDQRDRLGVLLKKQKAEIEALPAMKCEEWVDTVGFIRDDCPAWIAFSRADHVKETQRQFDLSETAIDQAAVAVTAENEKVATARGSLGAAETDFENHKADIDRLGKELSVLTAFNRKQETFDRLFADRKRETERIGQFQEELVRVSADLAEMAPLRLELDKVVDDISGFGKQIQEIENGIKTAVRIVSDLEKEKVRRVEKEKALEEALASRDELERKSTALRIDADAWSLLESAFHSTGIPLLLMRKILPSLEAEANYLLSATDISVQIEPVRERADGSKKDDIEVRFFDSRGDFSLNSSSGYQEQILGLAIRFALATTSNEFWGRPLILFIQDEGFGAFHPERYPIAIDIIEKIAARFERFVYITHVPELAEIADHRLEVRTINPGTSRVVDLSAEK